jgi:putative ABC transport system substrate-binding protein
MSRRDFIVGLAGAAIFPLIARAQQPVIPIFGMLLVFSREAGKIFTGPISSYMHALGYTEGKNIAFDFRFAEGNPQRLPELASQLVAIKPTVIATFGDAAARAAQAATTSIPIVAQSEDLVRANLVSSMRQPEGNITGVSIMGTELDAKRLEILAEMLPKQSTVLLLADPTTHRESRPALNATAQALGLTLQEAIVGSPQEIEQALRGAREKGVAGVNVLSSAMLFALRGRIVSLAAELGLPAVFQWPETVEEGGFVAYGPSLLGAFRQVTTLVDRVLKGAKPRDLPVEQPTRFALYVNLKAAHALGVTVPHSILLRADKAIE